METSRKSVPPRTTSCPSCGHALSSYTPPHASRGETAASEIASVVAGWGFPAVILSGVITWGVINVVARPIEPYPVVVLGWISAVLATVAACQGPLILLAQRRSAMNDRARDEEAFHVALNAEADIHELRQSIDDLHGKLDALAARD